MFSEYIGSFLMYINVLYQSCNEEECEALKKFAESKLAVKTYRIRKRSCQQDFHYDASEICGPRRKAIKDTNRKLLEETKDATRALDDIQQNSYDYTSK